MPFPPELAGSPGRQTCSSLLSIHPDATKLQVQGEALFLQEANTATQSKTLLPDVTTVLFSYIIFFWALKAQPGKSSFRQCLLFMMLTGCLGRWTQMQ